MIHRLEDAHSYEQGTVLTTARYHLLPDILPQSVSPRSKMHYMPHNETYNSLEKNTHLYIHFILHHSHNLSSQVVTVAVYILTSLAPPYRTVSVGTSARVAVVYECNGERFASMTGLPVSQAVKQFARCYATERIRFQRDGMCFYSSSSFTS